MSEEIRIDGNNEVLKFEIEKYSRVVSNDLLDENLFLPNMLAEIACLDFILDRIDARGDNKDISVYLPAEQYGEIMGRVKRRERTYIKELSDLPLIPIEPNRVPYFLSISDSPKYENEFQRLTRIYSGIAEPKWMSCFSSTTRRDIMSTYKFEGVVFAEEEMDPTKLDASNIFVVLGGKFIEKGFQFDNLRFLFWQLGILKNIEELNKEELRRLLIEG